MIIVTGSTSTKPKYPVVVASQYSSGASGLSTLSMALPSGRINGDLLLAFVGSYAAKPTAPANWWTEVDGGTAARSTLSVMSKFVDGSETSPISVSMSASDYHDVTVMLLRGVDQLMPIDVSAAGGSTSGTTSHVTPGLTTRVDKDLVLRAVARYSVATGSDSWTWPGGTTEATDNASSTNSGGGYAAIGSGLSVASPAGVQSTVTATSVDARDYGSATLAIAPPVTNGTISSAAALNSNSATGLASLTVSAPTVGNIRVMSIQVGNTATVTGVSGGGVSNWQLVKGITGNSRRTELWWGVVDSGSGTTVSVTYSGSVSSVTVELSSQQFASSLSGSTWQVDNSNSSTSASGTTITLPSLAPSRANGLYWGYSVVGNSPTAGSTTGFIYATTNNGNMTMYKLNATAAEAPSFTQSSSGTSNRVAAVFSSFVNT